MSDMISVPLSWLQEMARNPQKRVEAYLPAIEGFMAQPTENAFYAEAAEKIRGITRMLANADQNPLGLTKPTIKQFGVVFSDENGAIRIRGFSFENGSMELAMDAVADAVRAAGMKAFTDGCTWQDFYDTERKP